MQLEVGKGVRVGRLPEVSVEVLSSALDAAVLELEVGSAPGEREAAWRAQGLFVEVEPWSGGCRVRLSRRPLPPVMVLTELEAPEPMRRILERFATLEPGDVLLALLPHVPVPLFPHLEQRGAWWDVARRADGTALLWVQRGGGA